ncbi:NAD(+) diphosphatase [Planosporangium thailandense]|uniref:NAD(+) diphosphatase n=1 Tax=Planosporangium thailandense TaxID=765197 RepID=A0ABX0XWK0_9ACTN|nr:NAD(+) diphosphatase [Planosporangium thailandense]NJC69563.1 NAD(+) diphosphatase [Planosporangium thailandense]
MRLPPGARPAIGGFDRAAHRRTDADWLERAWSDALVVVVDEGRALVRDEPPSLVFTPAAEVDAAERYFLGEDARGRAYFAVDGGITAPPGTHKATIRDVGHILDEPDASLLMTAVALVNWHARHRYSARTGRPTTLAQGGWTRVADDGETLFPRTDPAVIMLVHDGVPGPAGRCLLGHNGAWKAPGWARRYSCLAGFVEPGEPAEATVIREVDEEVGVEVRDVHYVASQAWPFPGSLMLGYLAVADPDQPVRVDAEEITDARWFSRAEVARSLAGDETDFGLPMAASIAHYLIRTWLSGSPTPPAGP